MKNQDLQIKIKSPVLKNIVPLMEDNPRIYVQVRVCVYIYFYIIHQNTFTSFLKLRVPKKQHRIISTAHINSF